MRPLHRRGSRATRIENRSDLKLRSRERVEGARSSEHLRVSAANGRARADIPMQSPLQRRMVSETAELRVTDAEVQVQGLHCRNAFDQGNPHLGERLPSFDHGIVRHRVGEPVGDASAGQGID